MKTAPEQRPPYKPDNASLREAIRLAQQSDGSALELLCRLHCKRVYATVISIGLLYRLDTRAIRDRIAATYDQMLDQANVTVSSLSGMRFSP